MNVIFCCLDTYRADCVAAAGRNSFIKTPSLDRVAREGVLFDNAFGEGQPTIQFRRAMITGRRSFPFVHDVDTRGLWPMNSGWHKVFPDQPTIGEILLEEGYATGLVADTYHMFKPTQNFTRGIASWDFIRGQETDNWRSGPLDALDLKRYIKDGVTGASDVTILTQYLLNMQGRRTGDDDRLPAMVFSSALRWLDDNAANKPFFLWIDCFGPHEPFDPPTAYADAYDPDWDEDWEPIYVYHPEKMDEAGQRRVKALYHGYCTYVDAQVGRLLDKLDETGLADDTLLVVCSDHGIEMFDHGCCHKNEHKCRYRPNNEILLMMRLPGKQFAGRRIEGFAQNQDLMPTILGRLGVESPETDGLDLWPMIAGETDAVRDHVVTGWSGSDKTPIMANVRDMKYSYSCACTADDPDEYLFDVVDDPEENDNIAASKPEVVAEQRRRLEAFLGESLPAERRDVLRYTNSPVKIWVGGAPWAEGVRAALPGADWDKVKGPKSAREY